MPADFFAQGDIHIFVKLRHYENLQQGGFQFLGTAVTSPRINGQLIYKDIQSERVQPGPYNKMLQTERHLCSMVLNRVNHRTWNRIKNVGSFSTTGSDTVRRVDSGRLIVGSTDFELFFKYTHTFTQIPMPDGSPKGRLYYSAVLLDFEEDSPARTQELSLLVECNPLPKEHKLLLYTEREQDFPTVEAE